MAVFTGYHGTNEYAELKIMEGGFRASSEGWLGQGVYFFESKPGFDGLDDAKWWATVYKKYHDWVILKVRIESEKVFDMFGSKKDRAYFDQIKKRLLDKHISAGKEERDFNLKPVFLVIGKNIEVIRGLINAARPDEFVNHVVGKPQIQICVTKSGCITDICREEAWKQR
jgi:hypothetical protein